MSVDDITVDLGPPIPIMHARTLLLGVQRLLDSGDCWDRNYYTYAVSLKALLTYRIAKAEKTATYSEPG